MTPKQAPATPTAREAAALSYVRTLVATLTQSARSVEQRTGITNAQLFLLQQVTNGELSINDLAARALTTQSTVSILVSRLSHAGLVRRAHATDDARRVVVSLTAKGRRLLERAPVPPTARLTAAMQAMSGTQLRELERGLSFLLRRMHAGAAGSPMLFESSARPRSRRKAP